MALSSSNKLDFVPAATTGDAQFLPSFDWRTIGAVFALGKSSEKHAILDSVKVSGRCTCSAREGFDPIDGSPIGRVLEAHGDFGLTLRAGNAAASLTAGNLVFRSGLGNPLWTERVGEASVPSLRLTIAREYSEDCYAALSWDIAQKKPTIAFAWAGQTFTERAAVVVHADPLLRTYKLAASAAFPGPEWRRTYINKEQASLEYPMDDGARHRLWVTHTMKDRQFAYQTGVGAAFDLGRLLNCAAEFIDSQVQPRIPGFIWRVPLTPFLYDRLVPQQDVNQVRIHVRDTDAEISHEFGQHGVLLGLAKHFKHATLRGAWHTGKQEAALTYKRSVMSITARIARQPAFVGGWGKPSLMLAVEPLGVL